MKIMKSSTQEPSMRCFWEIALKNHFWASLVYLFGSHLEVREPDMATLSAFSNSLRISSPLFFLHFSNKKLGAPKKKEHHGRSQWPYDHVITDDSRRASQVSPRFEQDRSTLWRSTLDLSMAPEARQETLPERGRWKFLGYVMGVFNGIWSQYIMI